MALPPEAIAAYDRTLAQRTDAELRQILAAATAESGPAGSVPLRYFDDRVLSDPNYANQTLNFSIKSQAGSASETRPYVLAKAREILAQRAALTPATTTAAAMPATSPAASGGSNTMLYVGLGVVGVAAIAFLVLRKK
jgi:hypothetical protein